MYIYNKKMSYKFELDCNNDDSIYYDFDFDSRLFFKKIKKKIESNGMRKDEINYDSSGDRFQIKNFKKILILKK